MPNHQPSPAPNSALHAALNCVLLIALGFAASLGCGPDQGSAQSEGAKPAGDVAPAVPAPATATADATPAPDSAPHATSKPPAPRTGGGRFELNLEGNTIIPAGGASTDPFSVIDVEITAPTPFRLKLRVQPELAPDLASTMVGNVGGKGSTSFAIKEMDGTRIGASLKLARTTFTVAGRPIDVAGKHLQVCGIDLGPLEMDDVITLAKGEVRVEDVFRGPLPAPVAVEPR